MATMCVQKDSVLLDNNMDYGCLMALSVTSVMSRRSVLLFEKLEELMEKIIDLIKGGNLTSNL